MASSSTPNTPQAIPAEMENFVVGLIGMGDMGKIWASAQRDFFW
ncbi:prephenate dehydrogenase [Colletotrichum gloeosporioides Cg-14]|uniref:Prephenate dehydrogenase n=1 Tax=Colletotrichum gloeosporioides (strain Cg-14) TaxID=1237896 RepID=T0JZE4_COLGC|nr:prephenate dehydrogenase [Colletotrichum gloeosporioides Cg-14]